MQMDGDDENEIPLTVKGRWTSVARMHIFEAASVTIIKGTRNVLASVARKF